MEKYIAVSIVLMIFLCGSICMCLAIIHTSRMFNEVRSSKNYRVQLIPWAAFLFSSTLTDQGRKHRAKMLTYLIIAISCAISLVVFRLLIGGS